VVVVVFLMNQALLVVVDEEGQQILVEVGEVQILEQEVVRFQGG
jgi:hypothetical protein